MCADCRVVPAAQNLQAPATASYLYFEVVVNSVRFAMELTRNIQSKSSQNGVNK